MNIHIASDLHLEFLEKKFPDYLRIDRLYTPFADVLVLAGDVHVHNKAIEKFGQWPHPVLYVPGNHEFFEQAINPYVQGLRHRAQNTAMIVLFRDEFIFQGVRFLGCTLWTDYQLMGSGPRQHLAMLACESRLVDHRKIRGVHAIGEGFSAQKAFECHLQDRAWLEQKLSEPFSGPTVVITHHAPSRASVHPRFKGDPCNAGFVSDLDGLVEKADLWIHGHVHDSFDYRIGKCRVVANPGSYASFVSKAKTPQDLCWENAHFDAQFVVEVQEQ